MLSQIELDDIVRRALAEDVGHGDLTTAATVRGDYRGHARISVKQPSMVFAGGFLIGKVLEMADAEPRLASLADEGASLKQGDIVAEIEGRVAGLLTGERVALNFVQLLSGIATVTRVFVDEVAGTRARIVDTRKTHPGLR